MIITVTNTGGAQGDLYWSRTVFLLKDIGINGASNNSFYDDGPYKFLPTRNGDVTQGSFSPFGPLSGTADSTSVGGSVWFDGSGDYLSLASNSAFDFGTGDFCFEAWINPTAVSITDQTLLDTRAANGDSGIVFFINSTGKLSTWSSSGTRVTSSDSLVANTWQHFAYVRSSGTLTVYINGKQSGTLAYSSAITNPGSLRIGIGFSSGSPFTGVISNLRVVKGSPVYTADFKPPTAPLTAIAGTSLLTCQSATAITDASSNAFTVSKYGDARAVSDSPFGWGSVYFDGSGDILSVADNTALNMGTGDFTWELWFYATVDGWSCIMEKGPSSGGTTHGIWIANGKQLFYSGGPTIYGTAGKVALNAWNHAAVTRASGVVKLWLNGSLEGSASDSTDYTTTGSALSFGSRVAGHPNGQYPLTGYVSNARIVKGSAVYTSAFTPSTAPLTAITGTSLLTCQDKGSIVDASTNSFTVSRVGDAKPVGMTPFAQKAAGYWSGTGFGGSNRLTAASNTAFEHGTGDFTIEGWIMPLSWGNGATLFSHWDGSGARFIVTLYDGVLSIDTTQGMSGLTNNFTATTKLNKWHHVAVTRSGSTWRFFVDGTIVGTVTYTGTYAPTSMSFNIGAYTDGYTTGTSQISNVRVVKGTAIYTSVFTPPTAPLTAISGTSLLALQDNRFKDNSGNNFTLTPTGSISVSRSNPFGPTLPAPTVNVASAGSVYMDGSGSGYLTAPANSQFLFNGDLTIEAWICPNSTAYQTIYATGGAGANDQFTIKPGSGSAEMYFCGTAGALTTTGTIPVGAWSHVAVSRSGSTIRGFINGVLVGSVTFASAVGSSSVTPRIGYRTDNVQNVNGYLSNVRVVNGTALYTSSFTPSTSPLTAVSGTALLTCQDGATITDASSNGFTITKVGTTAVVSDATPFKRVTYPYGGSAFFDGSGDYLSMNKTSYTDFGTGNFTIEGWFNTNVTSRLDICGQYYSSTATGWGLALGVNSTRDICFYNGNSAILASSGNVWNPGCWNHFAVVRNGTNLSTYINGVSVASTTYSTDVSHPSSPYVYVGWGGGSGGPVFNGYLSNLRVVKGVAVYTANFTPPVAPVDAVGGTSLLLNFDNAGIYDGSNTRNLPTVGTAKLSSTAAKFGNAALYFDGTTYMPICGTTPSDYAFGTGDFTIEMWAYAASMSGNYILYDGRVSDSDQTYYPTILITGGTVCYFANAATVITGSTLSANTWYHIAVSRVSGSTKLFVNGTQVGSTYSDTTSYRGGNTAGQYGPSPRLGSSYTGLSWLYTGYLEDVRVTRGIGRYSSNFTPGEAPTRKS